MSSKLESWKFVHGQVERVYWGILLVRVRFTRAFGVKYNAVICDCQQIGLNKF